MTEKVKDIKNALKKPHVIKNFRSLKEKIFTPTFSLSLSQINEINKNHSFLSEIGHKQFVFTHFTSVLNTLQQNYR